MFIFTAGVNLHLIALSIDFTDIAIDRLHTVHCLYRVGLAQSVACPPLAR